MIENINDYKQLLLKDFLENQKIAMVLSTFFIVDYSINKWIEGITGNSFIDYKQTYPIKHKVPTIEEIKNTDYVIQHFSQYADNLYSFFSSKKCKTYEDALNNFPGFYYCFDLTFFKNINKALFDNLTDYTKKKDFYIKKLNNSTSIKLYPIKDYKKYSGISEYRFPRIIIENAGEESIPIPLSGLDLLNFLFINSPSFIFFYAESNIIEMDEKQNRIINVIRKYDEPVIYETDNEFIITNSLEKLSCYNKYICIVLDLYYHYLRVFEKWVIQQYG